LFWEIEEEIDSLKQKLVDFGYSEIDFENIKLYKSPQRQLEWLTSRVLACDFFEQLTYIHYDDFGKPYLDNNYQISISHTKNLVVVALCKESLIGIDTEFVSDKIGRIALKFLSKKELENIGVENDILKLYLHWCAKEALYKVYGRKNLNFIDNLQIDPIDKKKGYFMGHVVTENQTLSYQLHFFEYKEFVVVWTGKKL
jgi:phosphopantetheinyl transferase